jgi:hypothetical protein
MEDTAFHRRVAQDRLGLAHHFEVHPKLAFHRHCNPNAYNGVTMGNAFFKIGYG